MDANRVGGAIRKRTVPGLWGKGLTRESNSPAAASHHMRDTLSMFVGIPLYPVTFCVLIRRYRSFTMRKYSVLCMYNVAACVLYKVMGRCAYVRTAVEEPNVLDYRKRSNDGSIQGSAKPSQPMDIRGRAQLQPTSSSHQTPLHCRRLAAAAA